MVTLSDDEFGEITIRKTKSSSIRVSVAPDGRLRATLPRFATQRALKKVIEQSRPQIRTMLKEQLPDIIYSDGTQVGKSHSILVTTGTGITKVRRQKLKLVVALAPQDDIHSPDIQTLIRKEVRAALRTEAKHYLSRRLAVLADRLKCNYEKVRFSHASSRWGSCSSTGTISLNIALMQLPFDLIDYVLVHELAHTKQMNHSSDFWSLVEAADPDYKLHRTALKQFHPTI